jgi:hypothetical protein
MYKINFIAYAIDLKNDGLYEDFLIPFTFFSLLFNENSHVEIIVLDPDNFKKKYKKEINTIIKINDNFLIRKPQYKLNKHIPNTYRFFEVPTVQSKYTYISDIDIMYLENLLPKYLDNWPIVNSELPSVSPSFLPYNNILRTKENCRLTGVTMVKNDIYYTDKFIECQKKYYNMNVNLNDELLLGKMCNEIHGLPDFNFRYRPIYGIHFSPNRGISKKMALQTNKLYYNTFLNIAKKYQDVFKYDIFNNLLNKLINEFEIH